MKIEELNSIIEINNLKNNYVSIKEFGLGFVQIKLSDEHLINFYTDRIEKFTNHEAPHNHQRDFKSIIYNGVLREVVYNIEIDESGQSAYCGCGDIDKKVEEKFSFIEGNTYVHKKGDYYYRNKKEFHSVEALNNTVTFITKLNLESKIDAIILADVIEYDMKNHTEEELWNIVEEILSEI